MKVTLSRIFDASKALATKPGKELADLIATVAEFAKQIVPPLQNGLSFADNWNGDAKVIELSSDVDQVVSVPDGKTPTDVEVGRVLSTEHMLVGFLWWLDGDGQLTVRARFSALDDSDPTPTDAAEVRLLVSYE